MKIGDLIMYCPTAVNNKYIGEIVEIYQSEHKIWIKPLNMNKIPLKLHRSNVLYHELMVHVFAHFSEIELIDQEEEFQLKGAL